MFRKFLIAGTVMACAAFVFTGCNKKNNPVGPNDPLTPPQGYTAVFTEGFENPTDDTLWDLQFAAWDEELYPQMQFSSNAAHSGSHSLTSDSNHTALQYVINPRFDTLDGNTVVGVQFYIMAKGDSSINFTVGIGKNAGSSAGLNKQFGIGFDSSNVLKTIYTDDQSMFGNYDSLLTGMPIQTDHWYQCRIEVNLNLHATGSTAGVNFYVDGVLVRHVATPTSAFPGIDRLLVYRGPAGHEGPKPYYVDDIVLYQK